MMMVMTIMIAMMKSSTTANHCELEPANRTPRNDMSL